MRDLEHPSRAELDHDADNANDDSLYQVVRDFKAQAWDEGWTARGNGVTEGDNPYRRVDTDEEAGPG